MSNLENLLRRYQEGGLTPEEVDELNQLTHRDQVFSAACQQAKVVRRRQGSIVCGVAAVLLVTGVVFLARPTVSNGLSDAPIVAQADAPKPTESLTGIPSGSDLPESPELEATSTQTPQHDTAVADDPIVACNTQCSPDSVINDIWKFLRT